jgi:ABC-type bacteriocin/lantibiotic exporter with double-glycine peptidase domain
VLAAEQADRVMTNYLEARQQHFCVLWRQILFSLLVQALASTVLLGLGGWLVISGQLTLGQLVAAELIVAVVVSAFTKLGKHFESFYDLAAAIDKLGVLLDLPLEPAMGVLSAPAEGGARVQLLNVSCKASGGQSSLAGVTLHLEPGERVAIADTGTGEGSLLGDLLFGLCDPDEGIVQLDELRISELRRDRLRAQVLLLREPEVFEASIAHNLGFDQPHFARSELSDVLRPLGLAAVVDRLPDGLETRLAANGSPLTSVQTRLLMLARALLLRPRLLVIDCLLDSLPDEMLSQALSAVFAGLPRTTILLITGRRELERHCDRTATLHPVPLAPEKQHRQPPLVLIAH